MDAQKGCGLSCAALILLSETSPLIGRHSAKGMGLAVSDQNTYHLQYLSRKLSTYPSVLYSSITTHQLIDTFNQIPFTVWFSKNVLVLAMEIFLTARQNDFKSLSGHNKYQFIFFEVYSF